TVLILLAIVVEIFMPEIMRFLAPGFADEPEKFALTVTLTRITFPYLVFISLVSLLGGILNSFEKFAVTAAAPILLNISLITAILGFRNHFPTPAHALAWGVFAAGVLQFGWLALACKKLELLPPLHRPRFSARVKKLLALIGPAALGAGVAQVNLLIDMIIASTVPEGVSYLYYADRINQLPLGVIGVGVGTALLPMLSKQMRAKDAAPALSTQNRAIELVLLLGLPAAAALMIIAQPIITTLFEHGAFTPEVTAAVYPALIAYAAGLPSFVLIKVLAPGFFANHDTKTPFYIASFCMVLNIVLNLALVGPMAHVGLALATTIAGWMNAGLMAWVLMRRKKLVADNLFRFRLPRVVFASGMMAALLMIAYTFTQQAFSGVIWMKALTLSLLIGLGLASYGSMMLVLKIVSWSQFKGFFRRNHRVG
ncbi:MAG: murein biosynthesis integral membrane protein MurJ, partial [Rickettsiales bacterium]